MIPLLSLLILLLLAGAAIQFGRWLGARSYLRED
jgi:hypothetical protein